MHEAFIPAATCTSALACLTAALHTLTTIDFPPRQPAFSSLPAELVAHIVAFAQFPEDDVRQRTNLALSATCHLFRRTVHPILFREVHLSTAKQLEGVTRDVHSGLRIVDDIRQFTTDLTIEDLRLKGDGSWPGSRLLPLINSLTRVDTLRLRLHLSNCDDSGRDELLLACAPLNGLLGFGDGEWGSLLEKPMLHDVEVPVMKSEHAGAAIQHLYHSSTNLQTLRIGQSSLPVAVEADVVSTSRCRIIERTHHDPTFHASPPPLKSLAMPFVAIYPDDLLALIRPPLHPDETQPASPLEHLEVVLDIDESLAEAVTAVEAIFAQLTALRHLSLRLNSAEPFDGDDAREFSPALCRALAQCTALESLEMGGVELWSDWPVDLGKSHPPNLRSITFLPYTDVSCLIDYAQTCPRSVAVVTYCLPAIEAYPHGALDQMEYLRAAIEVVEEEGMTCKLETREAEGVFWKKHLPSE
ncbi:hypothetical protein JCM11641_000071 [Rhodosporidiobolus odoratus]